VQSLSDHVLCPNLTLVAAVPLQIRTETYEVQMLPTASRQTVVLMVRISWLAKAL